MRCQSAGPMLVLSMFMGWTMSMSASSATCGTYPASCSPVSCGARPSPVSALAMVPPVATMRMRGLANGVSFRVAGCGCLRLARGLMVREQTLARG